MRKWTKYLLFVAVFILLAACSNEDGNAQKTGSSSETITPSETAASDTKGKVLRVRFNDDLNSFDPADIFRISNETLAFNIYSGLTTYDSETAIVPDLAESWETDDNITWTFHLRKGVQWQKGYGEFTSADVVYSYKRIMDPVTASPYAAEFNNVESIEAPDNYTVVIKLFVPDGNFLHQVANYHQGQVVKKEVVEKYGDQYKWNPVGTGPFAVEKIDPNSEVVFVRHEEYYKGPAPISKINFIIIKDTQTAAIALQNDELDVGTSISTEELLTILGDKGFTMYKVDNINLQLLIFNLKHPILSNLKVRQAFAHAIDLDAVAAIEPRLRQRTNSLLLSWMKEYSDNVTKYEYDPEKAKKLLAEAGYPKGFTVKRLVTAVAEKEQLEQEYLRAVGINMEFDIVDSPTFNQRRNKGEFEIAIRVFPVVNPDTALFSYLHPDNLAPKGLNGASYENPLLTEKLEAARAEVDPQKRMKLYEEVQQISLIDLPYLPMYTSNTYWPSKPNVEGIVINRLAQANFYDVDIK